MFWILKRRKIKFTLKDNPLCVIVLEYLIQFIEYSKRYYKAERTYVKYDFIKELARGKNVDINDYILKISEEGDTESNVGKVLNNDSSSKLSVNIMNNPSIKDKIDKKNIIFTLDLIYDSIKEGTVDLTKNQVSFGLFHKIKFLGHPKLVENDIIKNEIIINDGRFIKDLFRCHYIVTTKEISNSNIKLDSVDIELATPSFITLCIKNGKIFKRSEVENENENFVDVQNKYQKMEGFHIVGLDDDDDKEQVISKLKEKKVTLEENVNNSKIIITTVEYIKQNIRKFHNLQKQSKFIISKVSLLTAIKNNMIQQNQFN
ncbi:hypothetical protein ACTFIY_005251 [Dictyostelium cf. discoideum]